MNEARSYRVGDEDCCPLERPEPAPTWNALDDLKVDIGAELPKFLGEAFSSPSPLVVHVFVGLAGRDPYISADLALGRRVPGHDTAALQPLVLDRASKIDDPCIPIAPVRF